MNVVSIGEVLWDVVGTEKHLGGAAFNFAAHLARLGHHVAFVSAVGIDQEGRDILNAMPQIGLSTRFVSRTAEYATGRVTVALDSEGHPDFLIHRPAAYDRPQMSDGDIAELFSLPVDWIYFGTLMQIGPIARNLTERLLGVKSDSRHFYDINLRAGWWNAVLVRDLMAHANIVKLNAEEVEDVARISSAPLHPLENFCRACAGEFKLDGVCVTRGAEGCALLLDGEYIEAAGYSIRAIDTVGAGDAFSAAFLHGLNSGWAPSRIADFANRLGALVASRSGAVPPWSIAEVEALR